MAQNIAKNTSDVIGHGVLVTDENGMIIGCNDEKRIGEYHRLPLRSCRKTCP
jgi:carbohydrate diacid regulator